MTVGISLGVAVTVTFELWSITLPRESVVERMKGDDCLIVCGLTRLDMVNCNWLPEGRVEEKQLRMLISRACESYDSYAV